MKPSVVRPLVALIVDDEPFIRLPVTWLLEEHGLMSMEAGSGDEALAILQNGAQVDLLITDVRMPGKIDGFQLVEHARRLRGALPIIVMSGMPWNPCRPPSTVPRDFTYLEKPVPAARLLAAIDGLLGRRGVSAGAGGARLQSCVIRAAAPDASLE